MKFVIGIFMLVVLYIAEGEGCVCAAYSDPVCGSDGVTYSNECFLGCENQRREEEGLAIIRKVHHNPCVNRPCRCPEIIQLICGTDYNTYGNGCFLNCASKERQAINRPPIAVKSIGTCYDYIDEYEEDDDRCICPMNLDPVCASDGQTYGNPCLLGCENKRREKEDLPLLHVVHRGECISCACTPIYDPVCASDNKTYHNKCHLNCENKRRAEAGLPPLRIKHPGRCSESASECVCSDPKDKNPVCGDDGKTYKNVCKLTCASLENMMKGLPPIMIKHMGRC